MRKTIVAACLFVMSGCSAGVMADAPVRTEQAPHHPVSGLALQDLQIRMSGQPSRVHRFRVEMAISGKEQAQGLMFRKAMGRNEGMLFPFNSPRPVSFWMHNTPLSLDIIFIGADRRILNIADHTTPYSRTPIPSQGNASAVLEINAGRAEELNLRPGDEVIW